MAIMRCNKCTLLQEQPDTLAGLSINCPRCTAKVSVYPTLFFIERMLEKYFNTQKELIHLRATTGVENIASVAASPILPPPLADIDLSNTDQLATEVQHGPIYDWFHKKHIKVQTKHSWCGYQWLFR